MKSECGSGGIVVPLGLLYDTVHGIIKKWRKVESCWHDDELQLFRVFMQEIRGRTQYLGPGETTIQLDTGPDGERLEPIEFRTDLTADSDGKYHEPFGEVM